MHTLTLAPASGCVYAFGAGTEGQLGSDDTCDSSRPIPLKGRAIKGVLIVPPQGTESNELSRFLVYSFATIAAHKLHFHCTQAVLFPCSFGCGMTLYECPTEFVKKIINVV
ncbi:hypothetical protein PHET_12347 [Paragonimus heterotremus]|uniref:Uncharacterized protein n=1 Tax=Paragonimus heterotremus TaxID=100268 RepID=A0A8J4WC94_9TREM|nr:hypothetical protein PHET_12347 [Paragonimus heterotremus]